MIQIHVVHRGRNAAWAQTGWFVTRPNLTGAPISGPYRLRMQAVSAARDLARTEHAELFIHKRNGQIADRNSYGGDSPRRPG